jgi:hypothetical protein
MRTSAQFFHSRPAADEFSPYYASYIERVPLGNLLDQLAQQLASTIELLAPLTPEQAAYRPKPDDWNISQVLGHLADTERVFAYRALVFARNDTVDLPGFDQDYYVANANFTDLPLTELLDGFASVRHSTLALFRTLNEAAWLRSGTANGTRVSVRALGYIIAGHELHHVADLRERYRI